MRAGLFRHRISIQAHSTTQDGYGQESITWNTGIICWSLVEPISGRQFLSRSGEAYEVTHRITLRYRTGITPKNRILFGSRVFQIVFVENPQESNIELKILCKENP